MQLGIRYIFSKIDTVVDSYHASPGEHFVPPCPSISYAPAHFVRTNMQYLLEVLSRLYRLMRYFVAWPDVFWLPRALVLDFRSVVGWLRIVGRLMRAILR